MTTRPALTLLELLLVLAVMASAACMALPNLMAWQSRAQLHQQAAQFAEDLRAARQLSVDSATRVCITFRDGANTYQRFDMRNPAAAVVMHLAPGITLHELTEASVPKSHVVFHEDGSSIGFRLAVRDKGGEKRINIERLTGNVTLGDMP